MNVVIKDKRGIVLIVVIVAIALLSTLVVDFIYSTHINYEISTNNVRDIKARYIAKSGINVAKAVFKINSFEVLASRTDSLLSKKVSVGDNFGNWELKVSSFPVGAGFVSMVIRDERAKLNLNSLVDQSTNKIDFQVLTALSELFRLLGIESDKSDVFISSLINWLDRKIKNAPNDQKPDGAKADYYLGLESPYKIKNGPLDSLNEIKLIYGMDKDFFKKVSPYLTVYTEDKKINLSTAPKAVIMSALLAARVSALKEQDDSILEDDTAEQITDDIIEQREKTWIITELKAKSLIKEVDSSLNISSGLKGMVLKDGKSETFSVKATGFIAGVDSTFREINAVLYKTKVKNITEINILLWKER